MSKSKYWSYSGRAGFILLEWSLNIVCFVSIAEVFIFVKLALKPASMWCRHLRLRFSFEPWPEQVSVTSRMLWVSVDGAAGAGLVPGGVAVLTTGILAWASRYPSTRSSQETYFWRFSWARQMERLARGSSCSFSQCVTGASLVQSKTPEVFC